MLKALTKTWKYNFHIMLLYDMKKNNTDWFQEQNSTNQLCYLDNLVNLLKLADDMVISFRRHLNIRTDLSIACISSYRKVSDSNQMAFNYMSNVDALTISCCYTERLKFLTLLHVGFLYLHALLIRLEKSSCISSTICFVKDIIINSRLNNSKYAEGRSNS